MSVVPILTCVLLLYPHPLISHIHASHRGDMYVTNVRNAIYETDTYEHYIYAFPFLFIDVSNRSSSLKYPATTKLFVGQNMAEQFLFSPHNLFSIMCYSNPSKPKNFWKSFLFFGSGGVIFLFLDGEITPDFILFLSSFKFLQWGGRVCVLKQKCNNNIILAFVFLQWGLDRFFSPSPFQEEIDITVFYDYIPV